MAREITAFWWRSLQAGPEPVGRALAVAVVEVALEPAAGNEPEEQH